MQERHLWILAFVSWVPMPIGGWAAWLIGGPNSPVPLVPVVSLAIAGLGFAFYGEAYGD
jgi:hypothetical protein